MMRFFITLILDGLVAASDSSCPITLTAPSINALPLGDVFWG
jgi:hypothetical protein